jgi:S-adenosylmethionine synthetase
MPSASADPVSIRVDTFGTGKIAGREMFAAWCASTSAQAARDHRVARPAPAVYLPTAAYGHFGRSGPGFTWEKTDKREALQAPPAVGARRRRG